MPELPEVETVRRALEARILGRKILDVSLYRAKNIKTGSSSFLSLLPGARFDSITRKGKLLAFHLHNGWVLVSHLRMEGKYFVRPHDAPKQKHDIFALKLDDGFSLVYEDSRKFGRLGLYKEGHYLTQSSFASLGEEPFDMTPERLHRLFEGKNTPIKEAIMDQSILCGLGNIYADETLFAAKIHPLTPAKRLSFDQIACLLEKACSILNEAIEEGGSTIKTFQSVDGIDGRMQVRLHAYGRLGDTCPDCGTPFRRIELGGRGTTFCPHCQKRTYGPVVLGVTGTIHSGKSTAAKFFERNGYHRFDADAVAKRSYNDPRIKARVQKLLGNQSYNGEKLNAVYVRSVLAKDSNLREGLNRIIHPYVHGKAMEYIYRYGSKDKVLLDVPLLFDSGMDSLCDYILFVEATKDARIKRLEKEGRPAKQLIAINQGYKETLAKKKSTFVIPNDGTVDEFEERLRNLRIG